MIKREKFLQKNLNFTKNTNIKDTKTNIFNNESTITNSDLKNENIESKLFNKIPKAKVAETKKSTQEYTFPEDKNISKIKLPGK